MFTRKGQNFAEYAILIAIVIGAAMTMQVYLKRGLQAKQADAINFRPSLSLGGGATMTFSKTQYEPYYVDSNANIRQSKSYRENITERGGTTRNSINERITKERNAYERTEWEGYNPQ